MDMVKQVSTEKEQTEGGVSICKYAIIYFILVAIFLGTAVYYGLKRG